MGHTTQSTIPKEINLEGLPEEAVRAFELMVEAWKKQAIHPRAAQKTHAKFATWPGKVRGTLTRREIYDYL